MMWMVFRNKWFALAWVAMVCAGVVFRFELSQVIWGGDPTAVMAQAAAMAPLGDDTGHPAESALEQENKARREADRKLESERAVSDDAQRPTVELKESN